MPYNFRGCFKSTYFCISLEFQSLEAIKPFFFSIKALLNLHIDWVVMQVDVENIFNNISWVVIFKELWNIVGPLMSIVPFTMLFCGAHFSLYYQHGQHEKMVTIIESS